MRGPALIALLALVACRAPARTPRGELEERLGKRLAAKGLVARVTCPDDVAGTSGERITCSATQRIDGADKAFAIDATLGDGAPPQLAWELHGQVVDLRALMLDLAAARRSLVPPTCELDAVVLAPEDSVGCRVLEDGVFRRLVVTVHADPTRPFSWRMVP